MVKELRGPPEGEDDPGSQSGKRKPTFAIMIGVVGLLVAVAGLAGLGSGLWLLNHEDMTPGVIAVVLGIVLVVVGVDVMQGEEGPPWVARLIDRVIDRLLDLLRRLLNLLRRLLDLICRLLLRAP
jgi:hypothetical protein